MRYTSLTAALLLAAAAPFAVAGEQAGDLPANHQAALETVSVEVIATGGHADTADDAARASTTPHADYAVTAGSSGTATSATNVTAPECPSVGNWYYSVSSLTGQVECVRDGGGNPNE